MEAPEIEPVGLDPVNVPVIYDADEPVCFISATQRRNRQFTSC